MNKRHKFKKGDEVLCHSPHGTTLRHIHYVVSGVSHDGCRVTLTTRKGWYPVSIFERAPTSPIFTKGDKVRCLTTGGTTLDGETLYTVQQAISTKDINVIRVHDGNGGYDTNRFEFWYKQKPLTDFKVGDKVKCVKAVPSKDTRLGHYYAVVAVNQGFNLDKLLLKGRGGWWFSKNDFELIAPVEKEEEPTIPFKKGDKVTCIFSVGSGPPSSTLRKGMDYTVKGKDPKYALVQVMGIIGSYDPSHFVLAEEEEEEGPNGDLIRELLIKYLKEASYEEIADRIIALHASREGKRNDKIY